MNRSLHIVLIEPYYGGSHAAFVDQLVKQSRHRYNRITLPARKWKWRMRGAATWFTREDIGWLKGVERGEIDLVFCSDMLNVADLRALLPAPGRNIPIVCYFHENQLTYPLSEEDRRDYQFGMTNITTCLAADAVWFNSRYHRDSFLRAAEWLMGQMPDFVPHHVMEEIRDKSSVFYPPVSSFVDDRTTHSTPPAKLPAGPLTILWSHRWEYDKNPEPFFEALLKLEEEGISFQLVCLGEQFRTAPAAFENVWDRLKKHIIHAGFVADRTEYLALLQRCDVVVSTAIQENFGIAMIEAILAGCQPLLPNRLVYPEIIPEEFHDSCLYPDDQALYPRLKALMEGNGLLSQDQSVRLQRDIARRFTGESAIKAIDDALEAVFERNRQ